VRILSESIVNILPPSLLEIPLRRRRRRRHWGRWVLEVFCFWLLPEVGWWWWIYLSRVGCPNQNWDSKPKGKRKRRTEVLEQVRAGESGLPGSSTAFYAYPSEFVGVRG